MAYTIFQGGANLYAMNQHGAIVSLALPAHVALDASLRGRFVVAGNFVVMVNSPSRPITIDANLNVRLLTPDPPQSALTLTGSGTGLTGTFAARQTYVVRDAFGAVIAESDFGPTSAPVTISNKALLASGINLSDEQVSASRLYRTTTGTSVYFQWVDVDGNTQTSIVDNLSDAGLATFSAPLLGTPPDLALISEFRGRLFGVAKLDADHFRYSDTSRIYAWPSDNIFAVPRLGSDTTGITGFIRRRDALGIGRAQGLFQFTGTSDADFRLVNVSENCGIEATDSVCVYRDTAFFLWKDGVYRWDTNGIQCVSDGTPQGYNQLTNAAVSGYGRVASWFNRSDTFNLARFPHAFAHIDPFRKVYRLFLASAGSNAENCWVEYDFVNNKWWGPHMSHAMVPSAAFAFSTDSGLLIPMIGATDGKIRRDMKTRVDDTGTPIDFDVVTSRHDMSLPQIEKYFGEVAVSTKPQPEGELQVEATVGDQDARRKEGDSVGAADLRTGYTRLARAGQGKTLKLRFRNNEANVDTVLRGYEVSPVNPVGRR